MNSLCAFVVASEAAPLTSFHERKEEISFLINSLIVQFLQKNTLEKVFGSIYIQSKKLCIAEAENADARNNLFANYKNLDSYIQSFRSQLNSKLNISAWYLSKHPAAVLNIDVVFIDAYTSLFTFNFLRKTPACELLH